MVGEQPGGCSVRVAGVEHVKKGFNQSLIPEKAAVLWLGIGDFKRIISIVWGSFGGRKCFPDTRNPMKILITFAVSIVVADCQILCQKERGAVPGMRISQRGCTLAAMASQMLVPLSKWLAW